MIQSIGHGLRGRGDLDPTPRRRGAQGPLREAHGTAVGSQKAVKGSYLKFPLTKPQRPVMSCNTANLARHPSESWDPVTFLHHRRWIPAFAGMTTLKNLWPELS
jgi:hypothetical protein